METATCRSAAARLEREPLHDAQDERCLDFPYAGQRTNLVFGQGKLDWLIWESWTQSMPFDDWEHVQRYQLETYAKKVMPAFQ